MSLTLAYFNFLLKRSESERLLANVMLRVEKELFRVKIAVKRREAKSKGEKERYTHLTAEVQRIARRDKKAFLSDQCKEIRGKQQNR